MARRRRNRTRQQRAVRTARARLRRVRQNKPARKPAAQKRRVTSAKANVQRKQTRAARSVRNVAPRQQAAARAGAFTRTRPSGNTVAIAPTAAVNKKGKLKKGVTYDAGKSMNARDRAVIQTSGLNKQAAKAIINTRQNATNFGNNFNRSNIKAMQNAGMTRMGIAAAVQADPQAADSKAGKRVLALSEGQFNKAGTKYDHGEVFNQQDVKNMKKGGMDRQAIAQYVDSQGIKNKVADRFKLKAATANPSSNNTAGGNNIDNSFEIANENQGLINQQTQGYKDTIDNLQNQIDSLKQNDPTAGTELTDPQNGEGNNTALQQLEDLQTENTSLKELLNKYENIQTPNTETGLMPWNPNPDLYRTNDPKTPAPTPTSTGAVTTPVPSPTKPTLDQPLVNVDQPVTPKVTAPVPGKLNYQPIGTNDNTGSQMFVATDFGTSSSPKIQPTNTFTGLPYDLDADGMPKYTTMTYGTGTTIPGQLTPQGVTAGGYDPSPPAPPTLPTNPFVNQYAEGGIGYLDGQAGNKSKTQKYAYGAYPYNFINSVS